LFETSNPMDGISADSTAMLKPDLNSPEDESLGVVDVQPA
jgi:hypothetical protein